MKFLIDLNMDGYLSREDQLDFSASYIKILWMEPLSAEVNEEAVKMGVYQ